MKINQPFVTLTILVALFCSFNAWGQVESSVLAAGDWFKIAVTKEGIYKIDRNMLQDMGLAVSSIDPRNISIHGYGGGMLPQENDAARPEDLPEMAVMVKGESDGRFDNPDFLLFYGQSPDLVRLEASGDLRYQNNLYSDTTYYFLTVGNNPGKRIISIKNEGLGHPVITSFDAFSYLEEDITNLISGGREWYGRTLTGNSPSIQIDFPSEGLVSNGKIRVKSAVMAQSFGSSSFDLSLNGTDIGSHLMDLIPDATYDIKGVDQVETFEINASEVQAIGNELALVYNFNRASTGTSIGYLNYVILQFKRELKLYDNFTFFRSVESLLNQFSTYTIRDADNSSTVWNITDPMNALNQEFEIGGTSLRFGSSSSTLQEYVVFRGDDFVRPHFIKRVENQNIRNIAVPDGLIIAHGNFIAQADRLASLRESNDDLDVAVVTVEQVYNEFASGRQDITAVRDFIKHLYDRNDRLKYVLLFGDASFDYKYRSISNTNFVPIYEARNSLHPIFSYSSDDYFGFMDNNEGFWEENEAGDHMLDLGVGRLPVKTVEEARVVVDKLINYESDGVLGEWRNEIYFVADDGDFNIHQRDADQLASFVDREFTSFNPNKIYLDAFTQTPTPSGRQTAEGVTDAINQAIAKGALLFNFTGHGNENLWCEEEILTQSNITDWTNNDRLPLFITATCEFGKYDNPNLVSGGELLLLSEIGGAIGLLTTSRPVFSNTNFLLNQAFYRNVFQKVDGTFPRLGDIIRNTKNESLRGPVNRNFALLGDPMMTLAYPQLQINLTELNGQELTTEGDTIKALGLTTFRGIITNEVGDQQTNYDGVLSVKVFDKPDEVTTFGNESNPTKFEQRKSVLFRGDVTISNGGFEFGFVVPKNISYLFKEGKVSLYASSPSGLDANGANISLKVGGSDPNAGQDNTPPELNPFLNNEQFRSGDETGPNPLLIVHAFDENGINISEAGIGQNISVTLDDRDPVNVNDFYIANLDTYQSGTLRYPLNDLEVGNHRLTVKLFDTHNNSSEKTIEFFVGKDAKNKISNVIMYPNPVRDEATISFSHNRISENLNITVQIYDLRGDLVRAINAEVFDNTGTIGDLSWDRRDSRGSRVKAGIFIVRILMRAEDGLGEAHQKLIVID